MYNGEDFDASTNEMFETFGKNILYRFCDLPRD